MGTNELLPLKYHPIYKLAQEPMESTVKTCITGHRIIVESAALLNNEFCHSAFVVHGYITKHQATLVSGDVPSAARNDQASCFFKSSCMMSHRKAIRRKLEAKGPSRVCCITKTIHSICSLV